MSYIINKFLSESFDFKLHSIFFFYVIPISGHSPLFLGQMSFTCLSIKKTLNIRPSFAIPVQNHDKLDNEVIKCIFGLSPNKKVEMILSNSKKLFGSFVVTFSEAQSFFPKLTFQGENLGEYRFGITPYLLFI